VLKAVQVITKEDEIHKIIGEVEAGGGGLSRAKRLTRSLRGMVVKKVDPRRVGEGDDEEDDEKEEEDEEEDYDDDDYQPNDDKHNNDKEDNDKEDDEGRDDERSDEGSDSGGVYGVDYVFVPVLAGDDHEVEGDEAEDDQSEEDEEDNNEEDNDYEVDEAPPSTTKKTQKSKDNSEIKLRSILAERQVDGQRQYLVDWHPIWTPPSSLPALLLDEWTKNSNNHTSQRRTNKLPKVQPPTNDDEDALMWQLIEAVLRNFSAYMYPDPSQSSAADELARQLFRDGDWTFHLSPTNLRLFSRHQIKRGEQNATAASSSPPCATSTTTPGVLSHTTTTTMFSSSTTAISVTLPAALRVLRSLKPACQSIPSSGRSSASPGTYYPPSTTAATPTARSCLHTSARYRAGWIH
jgi:hypothetical protein